MIIIRFWGVYNPVLCAGGREAKAPLSTVSNASPSYKIYCPLTTVIDLSIFATETFVPQINSSAIRFYKILTESFPFPPPSIFF